MSEEIYYCSNCGGVMIFDVKTQMLKCPNCDTTTKIVDDKRKIVEHAFSNRVANTIKVTEKTSETKQCKGCGAKVEISKDCTATQCPYCGSSYVLADKQEDAIIPDGVIPFKVDKNGAKEKFNKWINKRWLAPGKLKQMYESDKIQGIYLPYWTFDADIVCDYSAEGGKNRKVKETKEDGTTEERTVTDWYNTHGRIKKFYDDIVVSASKSMKKSLMKGVEPYDTKNELSSYSPQYLSGYSSECYTVNLEDAHREANDIMESDLTSEARRDVLRHYDEVRNVRIAPDYRDESYKHILIPLYATAYNYNNKTYSVLINGQTGKIKGDYPKSPLKIAIIILIIAAILGGIYAFSYSNKKDDNKKSGVSYNNELNIEEYCLKDDYYEISDNLCLLEMENDFNNNDSINNGTINNDSISNDTIVADII